MLDFMKTILSAVKYYIDKIAENIDGKIPTKISDLEQDVNISWDDLTERPFGEEGKSDYIVNPIDLQFVYGEAYPEEPITVNTEDFTTGNILYVIWNDEIYETTVKSHDIAYYNYIGDKDNYGNSIPFSIRDIDNNGILTITDYQNNPTGTINFALAKSVSIIKKIDTKYLPDMKVSTPDWNENDENSSSYIKNRPFYTSNEGTYIIEPIVLTFNTGETIAPETFDVISSLTDSEFEVQWGNKIYNCYFSWNTWGECYNFECLDNDCPFWLSDDLGTINRNSSTDIEQVTFAIGTPLPKYEIVSEKYLPKLTGATSESTGTPGIVPAPPTGGQDYVLLGDGKWTRTAVSHIKEIENYSQTGDPSELVDLYGDNGYYFLKGDFKIGIQQCRFNDFTLVHVYSNGDYCKATVYGNNDNTEMPAGYVIECTNPTYFGHTRRILTNKDIENMATEEYVNDAVGSIELPEVAEQVQADYLESDKTSKAFIKNRPGYKKINPNLYSKVETLNVGSYCLVDFNIVTGNYTNYLTYEDLSKEYSRTYDYYMNYMLGDSTLKKRIGKYIKDLDGSNCYCVVYANPVAYTELYIIHDRELLSDDLKAKILNNGVWLIVTGEDTYATISNFEFIEYIYTKFDENLLPKTAVFQRDLVGYATEEYVNTSVANLVDSAPEELNTLNELAVAMKENSDVVDALNSAITNKADADHNHNNIYYTQEQIDAMEFITIDDIDEICTENNPLDTLTVTHDGIGNVAAHGNGVTVTHDGNGNVTLIM